MISLLCLLPSSIGLLQTAIKSCHGLWNKLTTMPLRSTNMLQREGKLPMMSNKLLTIEFGPLLKINQDLSSMSMDKEDQERHTFIISSAMLFEVKNGLFYVSLQQDSLLCFSLEVELPIPCSKSQLAICMISQHAMFRRNPNSQIYFA